MDLSMHRSGPLPPPLAHVASPSPAKIKSKLANSEKPRLAASESAPVKLPAELFALATSRKSMEDPALSRALENIQAAASRLESERTKLVIQSQELQIWDMAREEELVLLRAENEQLESHLLTLTERVSQGLGRDGVVDSLQYALRKARTERDSEVREADSLFNQLQEARAAEQALRAMHEAFASALASLSDDWSAVPLLDEQAQQLKAKVDAGVLDPTNLATADVAVVLRGLVALATRSKELQEQTQRLQGENAGLQQALEATQEVLRQRQEEEEVQPVGLAAAFDAASRSGGHESREAATMGSKPSPRREAGRAHGDRQSERDQQGGTQQQGQQQQQVGGEQERELQRQLAAAREQVSSLEEQVVSLRSKLDEYRGFTADNQQEIEELQVELKRLRSQAAPASQQQQPTGGKGNIGAGRQLQAAQPPAANPTASAGAVSSAVPAGTAASHTTHSVAASSASLQRLIQHRQQQQQQHGAASDGGHRPAQQQQQQHPHNPHHHNAKPLSQSVPHSHRLHAKSVDSAHDQQHPHAVPQQPHSTPTRHVPSAASPISTINYGGSPQTHHGADHGSPSAHAPSPRQHQVAVDIAHKVAELSELAFRAQQQAADREAQLAQEHQAELAHTREELLRQQAEALQHQQQELRAQLAKEAEEVRQRLSEQHAQQLSDAVGALRAAHVRELEELRDQLAQAQRVARVEAEQLVAAREAEAARAGELVVALAEAKARAAEQLVQAVAARERELSAAQAQALAQVEAQAELRMAQAMQQQAERLAREGEAAVREARVQAAEVHGRELRELEARLAAVHAQQMSRREAELRQRHAERMAEQAAQLARLHADQVAALGVQHAEAVSDREGAQLRELEQQAAERLLEQVRASEERARVMEARHAAALAAAERAFAAREQLLRKELEERLVRLQSEAVEEEVARRVRAALEQQRGELAAQHAAELQQAAAGFMRDVGKLAEEHGRQASVREEELGRQAEEERQRAEAVSAEAEEQRKRADSVGLRVEALCTALEAVRAELEEHLEEVRSQLQAAEAEVTEQRQRAEGAGAEVEELRGQLGEARAEVEEQRRRVEELEVLLHGAAEERDAALRQGGPEAEPSSSDEREAREREVDAVRLNLERQYVELFAKLGREHERATAEARTVHEMREANLRSVLERSQQEAREQGRRLADQVQQLRAREAELQGQVASLSAELAQHRRAVVTVSHTELSELRRSHQATQPAASQPNLAFPQRHLGTPTRTPAAVSPATTPPRGSPSSSYGPFTGPSYSPDASLPPREPSFSPVPAPRLSAILSPAPADAAGSAPAEAAPSPVPGAPAQLGAWADGRMLLWPHRGRQLSALEATPRAAAPLDQQHAAIGTAPPADSVRPPGGPEGGWETADNQFAQRLSDEADATSLQAARGTDEGGAGRTDGSAGEQGGLAPSPDLAASLLRTLRSGPGSDPGAWLGAAVARQSRVGLLSEGGVLIEGDGMQGSWPAWPGVQRAGRGADMRGQQADSGSRGGSSTGGYSRTGDDVPAAERSGGGTLPSPGQLASHRPPALDLSTTSATPASQRPTSQRPTDRPATHGSGTAAPPAAVDAVATVHEPVQSSGLSQVEGSADADGGQGGGHARHTDPRVDGEAPPSVSTSSNYDSGTELLVEDEEEDSDADTEQQREAERARRLAAALADSPRAPVPPHLRSTPPSSPSSASPSPLPPSPGAPWAASPRSPGNGSVAGMAASPAGRGTGPSSTASSPGVTESGEGAPYAAERLLAGRPTPDAAHPGVQLQLDATLRPSPSLSQQPGAGEGHRASSPSRVPKLPPLQLPRTSQTGAASPMSPAGLESWDVLRAGDAARVQQAAASHAHEGSEAVDLEATLAGPFPVVPVPIWSDGSGTVPAAGVSASVAQGYERPQLLGEPAGEDSVAEGEGEEQDGELDGSSWAEAEERGEEPKVGYHDNGLFYVDGDHGDNESDGGSSSSSTVRSSGDGDREGDHGRSGGHSASASSSQSGFGSAPEPPARNVPDLAPRLHQHEQPQQQEGAVQWQPLPRMLANPLYERRRLHEGLPVELGMGEEWGDEGEDGHEVQEETGPSMPPTPGSVTSSPSSPSASSSREDSREAGSSGGASSATPRRLEFPSSGGEGEGMEGTGASGEPSGESSMGGGGSSQGETSAHAGSDIGSPAEHGSGSGSHDEGVEHTADAEAEAQGPGGLEAYVGTPSPGPRGRAAGAVGAAGTPPGGTSGVRRRRSRPTSSRSTRSTNSSGSSSTRGLGQLPYEQAMAAAGPSAQRLLCEGHSRSDQHQGTPTTAAASPPRRTAASESTGSSTGRVRRPQRNEDQEDDEAEVRSLLAAGASLGSSERRRRQRRRMGDAPPAALPFSLSPPHASDALRRSWEFGGGIATPLSPQSATHHGRVQGYSVGQWQLLGPEATSGEAAAAAAPVASSVSPTAGTAHAYPTRSGGASSPGLSSNGWDEQLAVPRHGGVSGGGGGRSRSAGSGTIAASGLDPEGAPLVLLARMGGGMRRSSSSSGGGTGPAAQPPSQVAEVHAYTSTSLEAPLQDAGGTQRTNSTAAMQPPQPPPPSSLPDPAALHSPQLPLATFPELSKPPRSPLPPILPRGLLATTPVPGTSVSLLSDSAGATPASATAANRYTPQAAQEAKQRGKALLGRVSSRVAELGDLVQRVSASSTPVAEAGGGGTSPVSSSRGRAAAAGSFPAGPEPYTPVSEPTGVMATPVVSQRVASAAGTRDTSAGVTRASATRTPAGGLRVEGSSPRVSGGGDLAAPLRQALEQLQLHGGAGGGAGGGGESQVLTGLVGMLDSLQGELRELQQLHQQTLLQQRQQQQPVLPAGVLVAAGVGSGLTAPAPATLTVSGTLVLLPQQAPGPGSAAPGAAPAAAQPHASSFDSPVAALQTPAATLSQADGGFPHVNSSPVGVTAAAMAGLRPASTSTTPPWISGAHQVTPARAGHAPASSSQAPLTHSSTPPPSLTPWDRTPAQTPQPQARSHPQHNSSSTTPSPAPAHATQAAPVAASAPQPLEPAPSSSSPSRPAPPGSVDPRLVNILTQSIQAQLQGQLGSLQARISELQRQNERLLSPSAYSPSTPFATTPAPGPYPSAPLNAVATPEPQHADNAAGMPTHLPSTKAGGEHSTPRGRADAATAAAVRSAALAAALVAAMASPREVPSGATGSAPQTPLSHAWGSWLAAAALAPATPATPLVMQQQLQQVPGGSAPHDALGTWPAPAAFAVLAPAGGLTPTAEGTGRTPESTRSAGHAGTTPWFVLDDASAAPWSSDRTQGFDHHASRFATPGDGGAAAAAGATTPVPLVQPVATPQHVVTHGSRHQRDGAAAGAHSPLLGLGLSPADAQPYSPEELATLPPQVQLFAPPQLRAAAVAAAHEQHEQQRQYQQKEKQQSRQQ